MKLRVSLQRAERDTVDLAVTCDATATVADLAAQLYLSDPRATGAGPLPPQLTLAALGGPHPRVVDPQTHITDSGLRSGQTISLAQSGARYATRAVEAAAVLDVVSGPDLGKQFALQSGSNVVGRSRGCQVVLSDGMVSRQHLRLNVTDTVEVIDLGSANGAQVNEGPVDRATLRSGDRVALGDTVFTVRLLQSAAIEGRVEAVAVGFIRSPRLFKPYGETTLKAPKPPERVQRNRFPVIALLAPVVMGIALYWFTQQLQSLLFIALSPLMMLGSWLEGVLTGRKVNRTTLKLFRADLAALIEEVESEQVKEVAARTAEHPSVAECVKAVANLDSLLWSRRPDTGGFAELRLGLGSQPSRITVQTNDESNAPRELIAELRQALAPLSSVSPVPVVVAPAQTGGVGVAGPRSAAVAVARSLVVQAATLHTPNDLSICAVASSRAARDWNWLKWLPHCATSDPVEAPHLADYQAGASRLLGEIEALIQKRTEAKSGAVEGPVVLLIVESDAPVEFARLVSIAEQGWHFGVFVLWVAPDLRQLPTACRVYLEARSLDSGEAGCLHTGDLITPVALETISLGEVEDWARRLAPVGMSGGQSACRCAEHGRGLPMMGVLTPPTRKTPRCSGYLHVPRSDLTTFTRLAGLGLEVVGQRSSLTHSDGHLRIEGPATTSSDVIRPAPARGRKSLWARRFPACCHDSGEDQTRAYARAAPIPTGIGSKAASLRWLQEQSTRAGFRTPAPTPAGPPLPRLPRGERRS